MKNQIDIRIKSNLELDNFKYNFKSSKIDLKLKYPQFYNICVKYKKNKQIIFITEK